eukprot:4315074-Pyramimonas_sp.AAC.1
MRDQTDVAFVYGATGTRVPDSHTYARKNCAALTSHASTWTAPMTEEPGLFLRNKRFWPTNLPKRLRQVPKEYHASWHIPIRASH